MADQQQSRGGKATGLAMVACELGKFSVRLVKDPVAAIGGLCRSDTVRAAAIITGLYYAIQELRRRQSQDGGDGPGSNLLRWGKEAGTDLDKNARSTEARAEALHMQSKNREGCEITPITKGVGPPPSTSPISKLRSTDFNFPDVLASESDVLVIGVAGGSGSGKTTYSQAIYRAFGAENMTYIQHDCYYKDLAHLPKEERAKVNFDHPDSLDTKLLVEHIKQLKQRQAVDIPTYDFSNHVRGSTVTQAKPRTLILVEGILIFTEPELYELLDIKIFLRTDDDIRLIRRMKRDIEERGRTLQGVVDQYLRTVRPMHVKYVEPSMRNADIIVPEGMNNVALDLVVHRLRNYVHEKSPHLHLPFTPVAVASDKSGGAEPEDSASLEGVPSPAK